MFSTIPATRWCIIDAIVPARSATSAAACCGVVTTTTSEFTRCWPSEIAMSPVPGGRSRSRTSRSPQYTSLSFCTSARSSMGPRQATTWSRRGLSMPTLMTCSPCTGTGMIMSSTWVGRWSATPSMAGTE
jgi:hypothetical protein